MRVVFCLALMTALVAPGPSAWAQAKPEAALSDAERAKRDGDKVFRFIKLQAQRPAAAAPAPVVAASPRPAVAVATRPAAAVPASPPDVGAMLAAAPSAAGSLPAAPLAQLVPAAAAAVTAAAAPAPVSPVPEATAATATETEEIELALLTHVQPELPNNRMGTLRSGSVWVQFTVEPDGRTNAVVARPGGQLRLAQSAVRAVQQWRFAPVTEARDVAVEIAFMLD